MVRDVTTLLDRAVTTARAAGHSVTGWTMQSSEDGYVAWLYIEDDEGQQPLFTDVDLLPTALAAAEWCLLRAKGETTSGVDVDGDGDEDSGDAGDDEEDDLDA